MHSCMGSQVGVGGVAHDGLGGGACQSTGTRASHAVSRGQHIAQILGINIQALAIGIKIFCHSLDIFINHGHADGQATGQIACEAALSRINLKCCIIAGQHIDIAHRHIITIVAQLYLSAGVLFIIPANPSKRVNIHIMGVGCARTGELAAHCCL